MSVMHSQLPDLDDQELAALIKAAVSELARRGTTDSFKMLVDLSAHVGVSLGEAARQVAAGSSWSQVADITGTTKQAAWSRWR
jgi:hypothetical protein